MSGNITFLPLDAPRLGDYAQDVHGHIGRIYIVHRSCPQENSWCEINFIGDSEMKEHWLSMLVYPAGAVVGPASRFKKLHAPIPEFHLQRDAADYFSDCVRDDMKYVNMNERLKANRG